MSKSISPLIALVAIAGVVSLGACNTVRGAGEDLQQAGEHVEERAEDLTDGDPDTP